MAKLVQISDDNGSNWYTLPGNSGELSNEAGELDDTIFGQNFKSGQSNLINWSVNANAMYKGFAGYVADIYQTGATTAMTAEAMSLVSGKTYRITAATKRVIDPDVAVIVLDNAVNQTANVLSIDYLFGTVTFKPAYTVTGPVTITASYLPKSILAKYKSFTLTQTMEPIDETDIPAAQANSGHRIFDYGLKTVSLEVSGVYAAANGFRAALVARSRVMIEINPDGSDKSVARGFFKPTSQGQSGDVGALEEETVSYTLSVPTASLLEVPFKWVFTSTDLSTSVVKCINAWQAETVIDVRYLPDGVAGVSGDCVVSDISLSGGIEAMNEFTVTLQGTGALATV